MTQPGLPDLPVGWCWIEARQLIAQISAGKSFKCEERPPREGEVGVVKVSAVTWGSYDEQESKTCTQESLVNPDLFVRQGDFLFSRANTIELVGACVIADRVTRNVMLSDKILRFSVRPGWERWLLWSLRSSHGRAEIERLATGNQDSMRNIGQERVLSIRIPLPANGEQQRIVDAIESYFTRLDNAVTTLERVERNLKRYRASVLKSAVEGRLVTTEAVLAKQEGRSYEPASVLLERILVRRRLRWSESGKAGKYQEPMPPDMTELPDLPEGWCWASVDQVGDVSGGVTKNSKRDNLSRVLPYLRVANVYANELRLDEIKEIGLVDQEIKRVLLRKHDLLVVEGNGSLEQIGRVALWDGSIDPCVHQNHLIKVRFDDVSLAEWALTWLLSPSGRVAIQKFASSTSGLHTLSISKIARLPIPLCPEPERVRISQEIARATTLLGAAERSTRFNRGRCAKLRQSILKWAFEGQLVDQNSNDELASELLRRIKAERESIKAAKAAGSPRAIGRKDVRA